MAQLGRQAEALRTDSAKGLEAYRDRGAEVLSRLDIFVKDMGIVTTAARTAGLPTPVASAAEQLYLLGAAQGSAALDDSAVITVIAPSTN